MHFDFYELELSLRASALNNETPLFSDDSSERLWLATAFLSSA